MVVASAASDPPTASVLPPGAGNEDENVLDTDKQDPKKGERSDLEETNPDRKLDTATIRPDGDGSGPAISAGWGHDPVASQCASRTSAREVCAVYG